MLKNLDGICPAVACNVVGSRVLINSISASHPFEREKDLKTSFIGETSFWF
ncbi:hypothetical protein JHK86_042952 [Glycine max]|nr:hypothetical protein JHK86_042952 [Glycine max]